LGKVSGGEIDGLISAAAAMTRLGWEDKITEYLPTEHFVPAVGQGALAIETRADDEITGLLSPINHLPTWQEITAERAFLIALGGGCRSPIAALGTVNGETLKLAGMASDTSGQKIIRASGEGSTLTADDIGRQLAEKMLEMGAAKFFDETETK
jgi:hydroxymethylbilane synthase